MRALFAVGIAAVGLWWVWAIACFYCACIFAGDDRWIAASFGTVIIGIALTGFTAAIVAMVGERS